VDDPVTVAGLKFPNRIGLGAGLDKNGRCIDGLGAMGFGHIEVGTVTPKPQPGNPQPRMFRLPPAQALINRMGFNNEGLDAFVANVQRAHSFRAAGGILGLNIGKNAVTPIEHAVDDYLIGLAGVYPHADYVAVNISSPNTKNLRALQSDEALDALLSALQARRQQLATTTRQEVPMFVKIAPDLDEAQVGVIAATLRHNGIDGVIATNTTIARDAVRAWPHADEAGGLSGAPVFEASNRVIRCCAPRWARATRSSAWARDERRRCARQAAPTGQARRRCRPGADLHRAHLRRPGAGAPQFGRHHGVHTTCSSPSRSRPRSHHTPGLAHRPGLGLAREQVGAARPSVGWWPTTSTGSLRARASARRAAALPPWRRAPVRQGAQLAVQRRRRLLGAPRRADQHARRRGQLPVQPGGHAWAWRSPLGVSARSRSSCDLALFEWPRRGATGSGPCRFPSSIRGSAKALHQRLLCAQARFGHAARSALGVQFQASRSSCR
jgi:dihydroorotate dehydrogenase